MSKPYEIPIELEETIAKTKAILDEFERNPGRIDDKNTQDELEMKRLKEQGARLIEGLTGKGHRYYDEWMKGAGYGNYLESYRWNAAIRLRHYLGILLSLKDGIREAQVKSIPSDPLKLYEGMQFHKEIINASEQLFKDGHYAPAIFEAFKAVNNFVKKKTGKSDLDGKDLMAQAFRLENPIIKLNRLHSTSDKAEQEGFMFLFMGAMVGIRNPKAHDNVVQTDPVRTLEYLSLASLLVRRAEEGELRKS